MASKFLAANGQCIDPRFWLLVTIRGPWGWSRVVRKGAHRVKNIVRHPMLSVHVVKDLLQQISKSSDAARVDAVSRSLYIFRFRVGERTLFRRRLNASASSTGWWPNARGRLPRATCSDSASGLTSCHSCGLGNTISAYLM